MRRLFAAAVITFTSAAGTKAMEVACGKPYVDIQELTLHGPHTLRFTLFISDQVDLNAKEVCLTYTIFNQSNTGMQAQPKFARECYEGLTGKLVSHSDETKPAPEIAVVAISPFPDEVIAKYRGYHDACWRREKSSMPISYEPR